MYSPVYKHSLKDELEKDEDAKEKKGPTDDTSIDVYSQLVNSQHVSGIIMPIDYILITNLMH